MPTRLLLVGALLSSVACLDGLSEYQRAFQAAMRDAYGEDIRIAHSFRRDSQHVQLLIAGEAFLQMGDGVVEERAGEVAQLALTHWDPRLAADSLTIRFVRFRSRAGGSFCGARSVTYGLARAAPGLPSRLSAGRLDISRTPCPW